MLFDKKVCCVWLDFQANVEVLTMRVGREPTMCQFVLADTQVRVGSPESNQNKLVKKMINPCVTFPLRPSFREHSMTT